MATLPRRVAAARVVDPVVYENQGPTAEESSALKKMRRAVLADYPSLAAHREAVLRAWEGRAEDHLLREWQPLNISPPYPTAEIVATEGVG